MGDTVYKAAKKKVDLSHVHIRQLEKELERRASIEYQRRVGREMRAIQRAKTTEVIGE